MTKLTTEQNDQLERLLRQRYQALITEVRAALGSDGEKYIADFNEPGGTDWGDASVADALADLAAARVDRQVREMRDIEAARDRMRQGEYGACADCGGAVPFGRLLAFPIARRCIACQESFEKTRGGESGPSL